MSAPVDTFRQRCEAMARDYAAGKIALLDAADALQAFAANRDIDPDLAQAVMAAAFIATNTHGGR
jgi:hypothetical protein